MIPHWQDSPYWARWLAQDADGQWCWFETEPSPNRTLRVWCTGPGGGSCMWARTTPCYENWTLSKRRYGADSKKPTV